MKIKHKTKHSLCCAEGRKLLRKHTDFESWAEVSSQKPAAGYRVYIIPSTEAQWNNKRKFHNKLWINKRQPKELRRL